MSVPYEIQEIAPQTWRLASRLGNRNVFQYLLAGEDGTSLLVDTGTAKTPERVILPAIRRLGLVAEEVELVLVTHPDADHQGGASALAERLSRARIACGFEDVGMVGSPKRLLEERYGAYRPLHDMGYTQGELSELRSLSGDPAEVDFGLVGGESLRVGDRVLNVHHAPGHSAGHLVLYEPASGILFSADAVHWRMIPAADGTAALPPTYEDVDRYLATIEMVRKIAPAELHSGHWPALHGEAIDSWLSESRSFVLAVDDLLQELLSRPATLRELCKEVDRRLGPFGADPVNLMFAVHGHLRRLTRSGVATIDLAAEPPLFQLTERR